MGEPELTFAEVGEILRLLQQVEGSEVTLEWGDLRIHVRRGGPAPVPEGAGAPPVTGQEPATEQEPAAAPEPAAGQETAADPAGDGPPAPAVPAHWTAVESPMIGTFYRAPKPDEPPFVEVGDPVDPGDTLALVEVMKLFTELRAEVAGKVARIDAADGTLVEFGQPLVWIEPA